MAFDRERFVSDCTDALKRAIPKPLSASISPAPSPIMPPCLPRWVNRKRLASTCWLRRLRSPIFAAVDRNMTLVRTTIVWALIGIYAKARDNIFWKRTANGLTAGGKRGIRGRCRGLPADVIHSVTNPLPRLRPGCTSMAVISSTPNAASGTRRGRLRKNPPTAAVVQAMFARENERLRGR